MVGGFIGVFIDVGTGFVGGFPWFALIGIIIGMIVASCDFESSGGPSPATSKEEKEKQNLENFIGKYKTLYRKLPKDIIDKLGGTVSYTITALGLSPQDTPQELLKMGGALATIEHLNVVDEYNPDSPYLATEYWAGNFTNWSFDECTHINNEDVKQSIKNFCDLGGASFNLYMFFGGTNYGFTNGAQGNLSWMKDRYNPCVTSYDYDAAIYFVKLSISMLVF